MNDAITKIKTSTEPINPISFNSVTSEFILTELTELTELTVVGVAFVEVDTSWLESVEMDSLVIIVRIFLCHYSSINKLICFLINLVLYSNTLQVLD